MSFPLPPTLNAGDVLKSNLPDTEPETPSAYLNPTAGEPETDDLQETIIERRPGWHLVDLAEIWRFRELLYFLIWRDIKIRYKQTFFGVAWTVIQPVANVLIFSLFLGRLAGDAGSVIPYTLFAITGFVPWTFFATALSGAGTSVVGNQNLVTKVYFPRLTVPMGAVGANLFDFGVAFVVLLIAMAVYADRIVLGWSLLLVPVICTFLVLAALGVGTLLAALTVSYRDFRAVLPFLIQFWMFATPTVFIQKDFLGPRWQALLPLNPAYGLIANFRAALLGTPIDFRALAISAAVSLGFVVLGFLYFRKVERSFADVI
jgi:lipopolysaccharide transport system permease protein